MAQALKMRFFGNKHRIFPSSNDVQGSSYLMVSKHLVFMECVKRVDYDNSTCEAFFNAAINARVLAAT